MTTPEEAADSVYNGRCYRHVSFRYDQLTEAIACARRDPERELMDSLSITFRDGVYHLGDFRYERLVDAVNYAHLRRMQGTR